VRAAGQAPGGPEAVARQLLSLDVEGAELSVLEVSISSPSQWIPSPCPRLCVDFSRSPCQAVSVRVFVVSAVLRQHQRITQFAVCAALRTTRHA